MKPTYSAKYPPVTFRHPDGITTVEAHKRADGEWQWTKRRRGRKVGTQGQGMQRCRAIAQARREAGGDAARVVS